MMKTTLHNTFGISLRVGGMMLLLATTARAHDFWMIFDPEASTLRVEGGHYFPRAEIGPHLRTIHRWALQNPSGLWEEWTEKQGLSWTVKWSAPGVYRAVLILQAPRAPRPMYFAQSLFVEEMSSMSWPMPLGEGLEISVTQEEDDVLLALLSDGQAVRAVLTAQSSGASSRRLTSDPDAPARLRLELNKRYLITATMGGQTASLSFSLPGK